MLESWTIQLLINMNKNCSEKTRLQNNTCNVNIFKCIEKNSMEKKLNY